MLQLFSPRKRATTWRILWLYLARAQKQLGLHISDEAVSEMEEHVKMTDKDFEIAAQEEKIRYWSILTTSSVYTDLNIYSLHDVMAHAHAYGVAAPEAAGIMHLGNSSIIYLMGMKNYANLGTGATSCYVTGVSILYHFPESHITQR